MREINLAIWRALAGWDAKASVVKESKKNLHSSIHPSSQSETEEKNFSDLAKNLRAGRIADAGLDKLTRIKEAVERKNGKKGYRKG